MRADAGPGRPASPAVTYAIAPLLVPRHAPIREQHHLRGMDRHLAEDHQAVRRERSDIERAEVDHVEGVEALVAQDLRDVAARWLSALRQDLSKTHSRTKARLFRLPAVDLRAPPCRAGGSRDCPREGGADLTTLLLPRPPRHERGRSERADPSTRPDARAHLLSFPLPPTWARCARSGAPRAERARDAARRLLPAAVGANPDGESEHAAHQLW